MTLYQKLIYWMKIGREIFKVEHFLIAFFWNDSPYCIVIGVWISKTTKKHPELETKLFIEMCNWKQNYQKTINNLNGSLKRNMTIQSLPKNDPQSPLLHICPNNSRCFCLNVVLVYIHSFLPGSCLNGELSVVVKGSWEVYGQLLNRDSRISHSWKWSAALDTLK